MGGLDGNIAEVGIGTRMFGLEGLAGLDTRYPSLWDVSDNFDKSCLLNEVLPFC